MESVKQFVERVGQAAVADLPCQFTQNCLPDPTGKSTLLGLGVLFILIFLMRNPIKSFIKDLSRKK